MAIKRYKPTTPGRRGMTVTDYSAATIPAASPCVTRAAATVANTV